MSESTSSSYIFPSTIGSTASLPTDSHQSTPSHSPHSHSYHEIPASENDEIDSLPSSDDSSDMSEVGDFKSDAQKEWEASLQQLELLLTMVVVPYMGKYFGRKFAYWGWAKYMTWMYDVEVRYTNKAAFNAVGAVEAAATL